MDETKVFVTLTESGALKVGNGAKSGDKVRVWRMTKRMKPISNFSIHADFDLMNENGVRERTAWTGDIDPEDFTPALMKCLGRLKVHGRKMDETTECMQPAQARLEAGVRGTLTKIVQDPLGTHCADCVGRLSYANWQKCIRSGDVTGYINADGTGTLDVAAWDGDERGPTIYIKHEHFGQPKLVTEINWSSYGGMPVAQARGFQDAIAKAVVIAAFIDTVIADGRLTAELVRSLITVARS